MTASRVLRSEMADRLDPRFADTGGCSGAQIIAEAGLGKGHTKYGISRSALDAWVAGL